MLYTILTNKNSPSLTPFTRTIKRNCETIRNFINDFIQKRKKKEIGSKVGGQSDLLSLFLSNADIFTDEFIIDEVIDFLSAGTQTS